MMNKSKKAQKHAGKSLKLYRPEKHTKILMTRVSPRLLAMIRELRKSYGVTSSFIVRYGIERAYEENKIA